MAAARNQEIELEAETEGEGRILIVGLSGSGKSTVGNKLLGKPDVRVTDAEGSLWQEDEAEEGFIVSAGFDSGTKRCQYMTGTGFINGRAISLKVVDTPGLFDPVEKDIRKTLIEVTRSLSLCCPGGPHVIIFVVPYGRFTEEREKSFDAILKLFGDKVKDHLLVVFSHGEQLGNTPIEQVLAQSKAGGLQKVLKVVQKNYVVCTNIPDHQAAERTALLQMIGKVSNRCTKHYSNDDLEKLTQKIESEISKLIREKGLSRARAIQEVRRVLIKEEERKEFWLQILKEVALSGLFAGFVGIFWGIGFAVARKAIEGAVKAALKAGAVGFASTFAYNLKKYISHIKNSWSCNVL